MKKSMGSFNFFLFENISLENKQKKSWYAFFPVVIFFMFLFFSTHTKTFGFGLVRLVQRGMEMDDSYSTFLLPHFVVQRVKWTSQIL